MANTQMPQWALSKVDQKRELESHMREFLALDAAELAPHERFFLAETIGLTNRGLFGMARAALSNAYDDAREFAHYVMDPEIIERATPSNLRRALRYLEGSPAQVPPVFR